MRTFQKCGRPEKRLHTAVPGSLGTTDIKFRRNGRRRVMSLRRGWMTAVVMLAVLLCGLTATAQKAEVPVKEVTLENGMRFLMVERY